eukprot:CAMPEP_0185808722 /NCGR_PEP_ID=MMETSP1322-20130828/5779_1 /TAXON_ID=265543 /ORGANISM="Minutocellus polymorphus, Strain RCC2270" /LENGTH=69 /DNA_ID=CAMNT_0028504955 /DNA_START=218 /DNA_END=425 /DNA_ORIENTATION=+
MDGDGGLRPGTAPTPSELSKDMHPLARWNGDREDSAEREELPNDEIRQGLFSDMAMKGTKIEAKGPHCA